MKAIVYEQYGPPDVLHIEEVEKPVPKDNEVLIKIHATTAHIGDTRVRGFNVPLKHWIPFRIFLGITKPKKKILGVECAGEIEAIGKNVKRFKEGDKVFALTGFGFGGYAQYICMSAEGGSEMKGMLEFLPSNMTYEQATCIPGGGITAMSHLRKANIKSGQKVLIYGASGSVGTYAVQLAKHYDTEVTGVCSTTNMELVKSLGADYVIDYTKEDFTQNDLYYDIIFDAVHKASRSKSKKKLNPNGVFISSHDPVKIGPEDMVFMKELVEAGKVKSVIDRTYPMEQIVEAHRYVEQGHKKGNVVIIVSHNQ